MRARFPLRLKIGAFAVLLVAAACSAVWLFASYLPAQRERAQREEQYVQLQTMLGATGAVNAGVITHPAMHPDLAYVVRVRDGNVSPEGSVAHPDRLESIDAALAQAWASDKVAVLTKLHQLDTGDRPGLVVKLVNLKGAAGGTEQIELGFSTWAIDQEHRARLRNSALVLAAALLAAIGGALFLGARIAQPARELSTAMSRTGQGSWETVNVASSDEIGLLARAFNDMVQGLKERERLKSTLARYVSDDVAARILTERTDLELKGEMREVTILFLDIRGFTSLSERMSPRDVVSMLNDYFEAIIEVIFKNHGSVNKFIGDAVMAVFGAPFAIDDAPMRAVRAAVEIEQAVAAVNHRRKEAGLQSVTIGIGINTGQAVAGNIGSERRMEYTVIGDEVNLAQRLEGLAREGEVLVSQATYDKVRDRVQARAREPVQVKGKTIPIWILRDRRAQRLSAFVRGA
ncbi:MAG: adenylate/guanylate cyclase domain-containing protein [Myxococcales bacterium]